MWMSRWLAHRPYIIPSCFCLCTMCPSHQSACRTAGHQDCVMGSLRSWEIRGHANAHNLVFCICLGWKRHSFPFLRKNIRDARDWCWGHHRKLTAIVYICFPKNIPYLLLCHWVFLVHHRSINNSFVRASSADSILFSSLTQLFFQQCTS